MLEIMGTKLQKLKFKVVAVENDKEFIRQNEARNIDVILLDIRTNGENSLRLLADIKGKKPETEVILLSNQYSLALAMEGIQSGAFDDISEPFDVDEISRKIQAAWKRKKRLKKNGRNRLARFWERTMMAVTYAEAGDFETAISLTTKEKKEKKNNSE